MILLRREIEGWFADKITIDELSWIEKDMLERLEKTGIARIDELYDRWNSKTGREALTALFSDSKGEI